VAMLATDLGGIYGTLLYISATYLAVFLTLGAFIEGSGAARFFIELPLSLFKGVKAGGAYAAVAASALMGMGSGSPVANVVTTGTFTIPLMKRAGFRPHVAAGIEAASSTGGQLMPPVMGAVAFVMADFAGVSYLQIITYAALPAILFFLSVGFSVYFRSTKLDLAPLDAATQPKLGVVLRRSQYLLPIVVLIGVLVAGYSAAFAAFWAIMCLAALVLIDNPNREFIPKVLSCLMWGGRRAADFAVAMACISIFVKIVMATGIGLKLPNLISHYADGNLLRGYVLTAIASVILGMGLPTVAAYIVVAVLAVPALTQMGAHPIQAHFFVLYFSILSALTPPIALAAFAGAQVANASYFRTALAALKYGMIAFVIPFLFAYHPGLLGLGTWYDILEATIAALLACLMTSSVLEGYAIRKSRVWESGVVALGALGAFGFVVTQRQWLMVAAVACLVGIVVLQWLREPTAPEASAQTPVEDSAARPALPSHES
jgi:TRAP transporter 4TM/12TM fusion protein